VAHMAVGCVDIVWHGDLLPIFWNTLLPTARLQWVQCVIQAHQLSQCSD
jgi:hypothetical protein